MLAMHIAWRYLFSKKSTNAINIITGVSMLGMGVGAFALVAVLSVFNGFEGLVTSLYNSFYPDIEIKATSGKVFEDTPALCSQITNHKSIATLSRSLEENAYFKYVEKGTVATLKGVDANYNEVTGLQQQIKAGSFLLADSQFDYAVIGANIFAVLNVDVEKTVYPLQVTIPKKGVQHSIIPEDAFTARDLIPSGIFSIQQEFDSRYVFTSLAFAQDITGEENRISAYEIKCTPAADLEAVKTSLQADLGDSYRVRTRFEQKQSVYRVMKMERWAVFAILSFVLLIISFNIIGSLSMLVLEKQRDISILKALGATPALVRAIFLWEGILAGCIGATVGIVLSGALCFAQQQFGFLKLTGGANSFVVQAYPVVLKFGDFVLTFFTVSIISFLASYFPAKRASEHVLKFSQ